MEARTVILAISAIVAIIAIYVHSSNSRRQATVNLVIQQRNDKVLRKARRAVTELNSDNKITELANPNHKGSPQRDAVLILLNNYEFIATGMRERAFDLSLYKRMSYSTVINDWKALKPFVFDLRRLVNSQTLFQEFQWLAERFCRKSLKPDSKV